MSSAKRVVLILLAICLIAGFATGKEIYYRLSYFWALLFAGSWVWSWFSLRNVRLDRTARTLRAQVGQIFEERYEVLNASRMFRLWIEVRNESSLPDAGGSQVLTMIGGHQRRIYWSQTLLTQRGVFPLGPTILASGDLFGIFPVQRVYPVKDSLLVYPMMSEIQSFPNPPGLLPGGEALRRRTHQVTPNASGVREYNPGDPLNRIHWVSTARRGRLMAKEFELDPLSEVWIFLDMARYEHATLPAQPLEFNVLDFWRKPAKVSLPPSTEEYAVSIAASVSRFYLRYGRSVGLVSSGQQLTLLPPDRGGRQLGKILEDLAVLHARGTLPLQGLIEAQAKHVTRGSTVIVITPTVMLESVYVMEYLLRKGLRPVAILLDTSSFGGSQGSAAIAERIRALGIAVRLIQNGANLETALSDTTREKLFA